MMNDIAIKIKGLSKKFHLHHPVRDENGKWANELLALDNIDLEVRKGESIGIIGPNGSGKSTLLKILAGVTKPSSGTAEIYGRVASILDIGSGFHPELSGRDNIFLNGQILGFSRKAIKGRFEEIVDFSGIEKFIDEPVKNYSNGMYLRLAFSIMIQMEANIYLLDETFEAGDAEFREKAREALKNLSKGRAMIMVSHNLNELSTLTDRTLEIRNGKLLAENPQKSFLGNGQIYADRQSVPLPIVLSSGSVIQSVEVNQEQNTDLFLKIELICGAAGLPPTGILLKDKNHMILFSEEFPGLSDARGFTELYLRWKEKDLIRGREYFIDLIVNFDNEEKMLYYPNIAGTSVKSEVSAFNKGIIHPSVSWQIKKTNEE